MHTVPGDEEAPRVLDQVILTGLVSITWPWKPTYVSAFRVRLLTSYSRQTRISQYHKRIFRRKLR